MTQLQIQNLQILVTSGISEAVEFQFFAIQWTFEKDFKPLRVEKIAIRTNLIQKGSSLDGWISKESMLISI